MRPFALYLIPQLTIGTLVAGTMVVELWDRLSVLRTALNG